MKLLVDIWPPKRPKKKNKLSFTWPAITKDVQRACEMCRVTYVEKRRRVTVYDCCSPNFNVPGRPEQTGLCERLIGTLRNMINKVADENPRSWHKHLGVVLWAVCKVPNSTVGVPPWLLAFGRLPWGPLAVLKDTMVGKTELPLNLGKSTTEYLKELRKNLEWPSTMLHVMHIEHNSNMCIIVIYGVVKSHLRLGKRF